jgi:arylsulfatase A-like enzyme
MTGRYFPATIFGEYEKVESYGGVKLPPEGEVLIPELFENNGYETAMVTLAYAWFDSKYPLPKAFDHFVTVRPKKPPLVTFEELNEEAFDYLTRPHEKPFFLYVHAWDTHFPHDHEPPYDQWLDKEYDAQGMRQSNWFGAQLVSGKNFSASDQEYLRGLYDGSVLFADTQIGLLVEKLEEIGILDSTLVIISADHGEALGEDGKTVAHGGPKTFDEVTHVPLIMAGPGLPSGRRVSRITQNVDIFPTIVDLLGLQTDAQPDGRSLIPLVLGAEGAPAHDYAFARAGGRRTATKAVEGPTFSLRDSHFRYEYDLSTKRETLFQAPDRLASRTNVIKDHAQEAKEMKSYLFAEIMPRWKAYTDLPFLAIFLPVLKILPKGAERAEVLIEEGQPKTHGKTDNKWLLYSGQLFAASFSEEAPPLSFHAKVPNGKYKVLMEMYAYDKYGGKPASSLKVKLGGASEFKELTTEPQHRKKRQFVFMEIGGYEVQNGYFDAVVAPGDREYWAGFKGFVLLPSSKKAEAAFARFLESTTSTQEEISERQKQLRALGYLE